MPIVGGLGAERPAEREQGEPLAADVGAGDEPGGAEGGASRLGFHDSEAPVAPSATLAFRKQSLASGLQPAAVRMADQGVQGDLRLPSAAQKKETAAGPGGNAASGRRVAGAAGAPVARLTSSSTTVAPATPASGESLRT